MEVTIRFRIKVTIVKTLYLERHLRCFVLKDTSGAGLVSASTQDEDSHKLPWIKPEVVHSPSSGIELSTSDDCFIVEHAELVSAVTCLQLAPCRINSSKYAQMNRGK